MSQNDLFKSVDARDWARAFCAIVPPGSPAPPEAVMLSWFSSALMAMFDHMNPAQAPVVLPDGSAFSAASLKETTAPDWDGVKGRAPNATGDLSSEEFVRQLRDEWDGSSSPASIKETE